MEDIEDCRNEQNSAVCPNTTSTTSPLLRKELTVNSTRSASSPSIKDLINLSTGATSEPASDPISKLMKEVSPAKFDEKTVASIAGAMGVNVGVEAEAVVGRKDMPSAMRRAFSVLGNCDEEAVSVELTKLMDGAPEGEQANVNIVYSISVKEGDRNGGNATKVADSISQQDMSKVDQLFNRSVEGFGLTTFKVVSLSVTVLPVRKDGTLDVQDSPGKIAAGLLAQDAENARRITSSSRIHNCAAFVRSLVRRIIFETGCHTS